MTTDEVFLMTAEGSSHSQPGSASAAAAAAAAAARAGGGGRGAGAGGHGAAAAAARAAAAALAALDSRDTVVMDVRTDVRPLATRYLPVLSRYFFFFLAHSLRLS